MCGLLSESISTLALAKFLPCYKTMVPGERRGDPSTFREPGVDIAPSPLRHGLPSVSPRAPQKGLLENESPVICTLLNTFVANALGGAWLRGVPASEALSVRLPVFNDK